MTCINCGMEQARRKGLCPACYMWPRRHGGQPRPVEVVIRHYTRVIEDELVAKRYRILTDTV